MTAMPDIPHELRWQGPAGFWDLPDCPSVFTSEDARGSGVYLWSVRVGDVHRVLYVEAAAHMGQSLQEHACAYLTGRYWLYDDDALGKGRRETVETPLPHVDGLLARYEELGPRIHRQLASLRIFYAPVAADHATLVRLESGLVKQLLEHSEATRDFVVNEHLAIPISEEHRVPVRMVCEHRIEGLEGAVGC
jgi:hypothetical protein